jgi:hypothetical protein
MSKVVKLKQSDIERLVKNIIKESNGEFDDFDTKIQPEELPQEPELDPEDMKDTGPTVKLTLGQDENGDYYIIKDGETDHPKIVAKTK